MLESGYLREFIYSLADYISVKSMQNKTPQGEGIQEQVKDSEGIMGNEN